MLWYGVCVDCGETGRTIDGTARTGWSCENHPAGEVHYFTMPEDACPACGEQDCLCEEDDGLDESQRIGGVPA